MNYAFSVREDKRIRVIIDTDAGCEADDPFAIVQGLLTPKFDVKAIFATHFVQPNSVDQSYAVASKIVNLLGSKTPVLRGAEGPLRTLAPGSTSQAASFLIQEALKQDEHPLYVLCMGAITNIAQALIQRPDIASRITIIWIGAQDPKSNHPEIREFNASNDITASNHVLTAPTHLSLIPYDAYSSMNISFAELQVKILDQGAVGKYLFDQLMQFSKTENANWAPGESWCLGDSPAVAVAMQPNCGTYRIAPAPLIREDAFVAFDPTRPTIRIYDRLDTRFIFEDLFAKLRLFTNGTVDGGMRFH